MSSSSSRQLSLGFDAGHARAARDSAVEAVGIGNDKWMRNAIAAIRYVAERRELFSTDAVWYVLEVRWRMKHVAAPRDRRAMGAAMVQASKLGICSPYERRGMGVRVKRTIESTRKACHARPLAVWQSNVLRGGKRR